MNRWAGSGRRCLFLELLPLAQLPGQLLLQLAVADARRGHPLGVAQHLGVGELGLDPLLLLLERLDPRLDLGDLAEDPLGRALLRRLLGPRRRRLLETESR